MQIITNYQELLRLSEDVSRQIRSMAQKCRDEGRRNNFPVKDAFDPGYSSWHKFVVKSVFMHGTKYLFETKREGVCFAFIEIPMPE